MPIVLHTAQLSPQSLKPSPRAGAAKNRCLVRSPGLGAFFGAYHNGSIWPHDNALIGAGFGACGRRDGVERLLKGLLAAAMLMDECRLPELFCGFPRRRDRAPVLYPVACSPQAWASGALFFCSRCWD